MIRLTVLYKLADGVDETDFIKWRTSEHEKYVQSMPGVIRNEFSRIDDISPEGRVPPYRFQTVVDWPDRESFEKAFYNDDAQAKLDSNRGKIGDEVFIVSELLTSTGR
jgi:hypothetical protein